MVGTPHSTHSPRIIIACGTFPIPTGLSPLCLESKWLRALFICLVCLFRLMVVVVFVQPRPNRLASPVCVATTSVSSSSGLARSRTVICFTRSLPTSASLVCYSPIRSEMQISQSLVYTITAYTEASTPQVRRHRVGVGVGTTTRVGVIRNQATDRPWSPCAVAQLVLQ